MSLKKSYLFLVFLVFGVATFIFYARVIMPPFVLAFVIAYLSRPFVLFMQRKKLGKVFPALLVTLIFISAISAVLGILIPFLSKKIIEFFRGINLMDLGHRMDLSFKNIIQYYFPSTKNSEMISIENFMASITGKISEDVQKFIINAFGSVFQSVDDAAIMLLAPVILYHMTKDWDKIQGGFYSMIPKKFYKSFVGIVDEINSGLSNYLVAQMKLSLCLSFVYAFLLYFTKLGHGILMGLLIGLFSFVPYLGFLMMSVVIMSLAINNLQGDFVAIKNVIFALGLGQMLDIAIINPKIMGNTLNLSPVWILFGVLSCSVLFGAFGMFFALPVMVVVTILFRKMIHEYKSTKLF